MNTRLRLCALALSTAGLVACADRGAPTDPQSTLPDHRRTPRVPLAKATGQDATAIPIGSLARIEFLGTARASRRSLSLPLEPVPVELGRHIESARAWLAQQRNAHPNGWDDAWAARTIHAAERRFAVQTPDELRWVLGPTRTNIEETRSARPIASGVVEHTASYGLDGRDLLRVVVRTGPASMEASMDCASDPTTPEGDPSCGTGDYDPNFDPGPMLADIAAMQAEVDALNAEIASLQSGVAPGECTAEATAYWVALAAVTVTSGEAIFYILRRNVAKLYGSFKVLVAAHGAFWTAYFKYRDCLKGTRPRYPV